MDGLELVLGLLALVFVAAPIISLAVGLSLRQRMRWLENRITVLEDAARRAAVAPAPGRVEPLSSPAEARAPHLQERVASPSPPAPSTAVPPVREPTSPPPPSPLPVVRAPWEGLEGRLGGTWLNRIGAIVLILGVGFFLKYSFERGWIPPATRVALGMLAGAALIALGERLRRPAYRIPVQGVVAAGVAVLYLSSFAAYGLYHLIPQPVAFALMALITAVGIGLAIHHDARAIAILANIGGFLTPVLLSTGRDAAVALFSYLAILDAGMLASAYWRRWSELHLLSFAFTQMLYWAWFDRWYHATTGLGLPAPQREVALVGASVFFVLFALVAPVEAAGGRSVFRLERAWDGPLVLVLAAPVAYFMAARAVLYPELATWLGALCLLLAAIYLGLGQWTARLVPGPMPLALLHWAIALAFLTLTFPVQFTAHTVTIAWSIEGAVIVWGGFRLGARPLRVAGLIVLGLGALRWLSLAEKTGRHAGWFLLDHPLLASTVFLAAAAAVTATLYQQRRDAIAGPERFALPGLVLLAVIPAALLVSMELHQHRALDLTRGSVSVLMTVVWTVAAAVVLWRAIHDPTRVLLAAAGVLTIHVVIASVLAALTWGGAPASPSMPVLNPRFAAGALVVVLCAAFARIVPRLPDTHVGGPDMAPHTPQRSEAPRQSRGAPRERWGVPEERTTIAAVAAGVGAVFLLWHLSAEVALMPLEGVAPGELSMARHMGLSLLWTVYAFAAMAIGIHRRQPFVRLGAIGLFGLTVVKVFLVDLGRLDAGYRVLSFVVLGGILLLASFVYTRYRTRIAEESS